MALVLALAGAPVSMATAEPLPSMGSTAWPMTTLALALCLPLTAPVELAEPAVTRTPAAREVLALAVNDPLVPVVMVLASAWPAVVTP